MSGGLSVRSMSVRRLRYTTNNFQVNAARGQVYSAIRKTHEDDVCPLTGHAIMRK